MDGPETHKPGANPSALRALVEASPIAQKFAQAGIVLALDPRGFVPMFVDSAFAGSLGADSSEGLAGQLAKASSAAARQLRGLTHDLPLGVARIVALSGLPDVPLVCAKLIFAGAPILIVAQKGKSDIAPESVETPAGAPAPSAGPETRSARFLWRLDGEGRFTEISPALAHSFGEAPAAGEKLADFLARRGIGGGEAWLAALRDRTGFNALRLDLPSAEGLERSLVLSGAPWSGQASEGVAMSGFGYGLSRRSANAATSAPEAIESPAAMDPPAPDAPHPVRDDLTPAEPAAPATASLLDPFDAPANENAVAPGPGPSEAPPASNVVPLRPGVAPQREGAAENADSLSPDERNAFREIARALGARMRPPRPSEHDVSSPRPADPAARDDFAALVDKLPIGIVVFRHSETLYANRTLLDLLDHSDLDALRQAGGAQGLFAQPEAQMGGRGDSFAVHRADGEPIPVDARALSLDWAGAPATLVALRRAIDGEARAALANAESEKRRHAESADAAEALLQASPDGFLRLDANGRIVWANNSAERLLGRSAMTMPGVALAALLPSGAGDSFAQGLARIARPSASEPSVDLDVQSSARPMRLSLVRLAEGAFGVVLRDLAPERDRLASLESARAEAVRASQLKSETLARISHEIRTPLHAILGFVEVMMEQRFGPIGNERYREYLRDIHGSGQHVVSLANDLLDIAKIESGNLDLQFQPVDANRIIRDCLALMQPQAAQEHVIMRSSLHDDLPDVVADERSLRQIILNVVSNAVKYNAPGGQVIVSTDVGEGGQAMIRVRDTGLGMDEAELKAAMLPFTQVSGKKAGGAGLGLPLTKALTEANHARFAIQSEKRQGTLVELTFPIVQAAQ